MSPVKYNETDNLDIMVLSSSLSIITEIMKMMDDEAVFFIERDSALNTDLKINMSYGLTNALEDIDHPTPLSLTSECPETYHTSQR